MDDRNLKWRVGVIAVATFVVAALLIAASTSYEAPFGVGRYAVRVQTDRAPGVGRNTPVRRDGVLIGRVESTSAVVGGRVLVLQIDQNELLLASDRCQIRPSSLFGDAVIDFAQADRPGPPVEPGHEFRGRALRDPLDVITNLDVGNSVESLGRAGDAVAELATRINRIIGEDADGQRLEQLLEKGIAAMDEFSATMREVSDVAASIDAVIGDEQTQAELRRGLAGVPQLVSDLIAFADQLSATIESLDRAIVSAERNLKNVEGVTAPLGERGPELAEGVIAALENLELALADVSRFAKDLGGGRGTIGKLVSDPALYDNVNTTVCNANLTIAKLYRLLDQLSPKLRAIVNDVRVTTDKVGREPGRVIGGAFNRGPGLK